MRALLLAHDFPPLGGGIARWMDALARRWPPGELVVSTGAAPGGPAVDRATPALVDRLPVPPERLRTFFGASRWCLRAGRLADRHRPEIVLVDTIRPTGYVAGWLRRTRRLPVAVFVHGADLVRLADRARRSGAKRMLARILLGSTDLVIANSHWTAGVARELLAELGVADRIRIAVVPLGSDPAVFRPFPPSGRAPGRRLLTVARLVPHKGIDVAIGALGRLRARFPDLRYLVVGEGPDQSRLERLASEAGVADQVEFAGGVPDVALPALYAEADVYLGLSRTEGPDVEGFGIALADASAAGKPVVAGRSGGIPETIEDGVTGLLVDSRSADDVADAVARLLVEPELAGRMGLAGRRAVETRLNWDRMARDVIAVSREAAAARR